MASFKKSRSAIRYAPPLIAMFLGCTALTAPAHAWSLFGGDAKTQDAKDSKDAKDTKTAPAESLDDSIRQAQMLRLAGSYPEAIKHLSQLMMVAADDSRVISEYGKTLTAMGRAQEAVNFLTRAEQLQPTDWTVYSALGVAYDQLGNQKDAATAYDRALTLKPGEPSVLSNYALSRLLAKDPEGARKLAAGAEIAGGASDPMIARNIAMVKDVAPQDAGGQVANTPAPVAQAVARVSPPSPRPLMPAPVSSVAMNNNAVIDAMPQMQSPHGVVMQAVPVDPLAGPVVNLHMPAPRKTAHGEPQTSMAAAAAQAASPLPAKPKPQAVKTANSQAEDLQAKAEAIAKTLTNKPAAIAAAKTEANKEAAARTEANTPVAPTSSATGAPRALQPAPKPDAAKAPEAPKPAPSKVAAKAKDTIPGLRMSANAY